MTGLVVLDVVIGLVFVYLLYSLLCTILQEIIATTLAFRAKILEKGLHRLLEDDTQVSSLKSRIKSWAHFIFGMRLTKNSHFLDAFMEHPFIKYLGEDKLYTKPSYLSAKNFSKILLDLLRGENLKIGQSQRDFIEESLNNGAIKIGEKSIPIPPDTLKYLKSIWLDAQGDVERFRYAIENWFDAVMDRTTGWYKQHTQVILLVVGFVVAVAFNVDTLQITSKLATDPELRKEVVSQADVYLKAHPKLKTELASMQVYHNKLKAEIQSLSDSSKVQKDSLIKVTQASSDSISALAHMDSVVTLADSLIKTDIAKINQTLGLGWECKKSCACEKGCSYVPAGDAHWFMRIFGWMITALAISLGAPFWFDLLNKLMKLRASAPTGTSGNSTSGGNSNTNSNVATIVPPDQRVG